MACLVFGARELATTKSSRAARLLLGDRLEISWRSTDARQCDDGGGIHQRVVVNPKFRTDVAYFIKQLGDQECHVKFILAGIAETVGDLLGKHESASRYLATVELERPLSILKEEVLEKGFERFDAKVPDSISMRVAYISDGFAHFTHLIGLRSLWV